MFSDIIYQKYWYVKRFTKNNGKLHNVKKIAFKENFKSLRTAKGLSQKQLGEILHVNQRTISAWEKGVCEPNYELLLRICDYFDERADTLLFSDYD